MIPPLKKWQKYSILILFITFLVNILAYGFLQITKIDFKFTDIVILSLFFAAATFLAIQIFLKGQSKEPGTQVIYTLASVSLKFVLDLILAGFWFVVAKKIGPSYVLLFFVLYLAFTLFLIWTIINTLKNKSL